MFLQDADENSKVSALLLHGFQGALRLAQHAERRRPKALVYSLGLYIGIMLGIWYNADFHGDFHGRYLYKGSIMVILMGISWDLMKYEWNMVHLWKWRAIYLGVLLV